MFLPLDRHSGLPVYRQILDGIRFQVAGGLLAPGAELPSTRALAGELGVNPMTVSKAYSMLEREGVVERRPGLALVVRALPASELAAERREQLARALEPAARLMRQLDVGEDEALAVLRGLLDGLPEPDGD